ncbi:MAG TPA: hypothetical protein ENJ00_01565 [Phycisphaerales bacterium]|nr:hypothetical protein [Phycisphaerales bacterium]
MKRTIQAFVAVTIAALGKTSVGQSYTTDPAFLAKPIVDGSRVILEPRGLSLVDPIGLRDVVVPTIKIQNQQSMGYDIVFTFRNDSSHDRPLGRILTGVLTLGERITYLEDIKNTTLKDTTWDRFIGTGYRYPGSCYSPVCMLMNDEYAVGVSLLYPVLEYKHDVLVRIMKAGGAFKGPQESRGWIVAFDFQNTTTDDQFTTLAHKGMLKPGEERSYTLVIRAIRRGNTATSANGPQGWLKTLKPYGDYFRSLYGGVRYTRHPEPVHGRELANIDAINLHNTRGMLGGLKRPDRVGFAGVVQEIIEPNGYEREMLWACSGVNSIHRQLNFPSRFTLGWMDIEKMQNATDSVAFPRIPRAGKQLGLWWGRAAEHTDRWDASTSTPLDPNNPDHFATVVQQLDLARDAGATYIGLDNFIHSKMPVWEQIPYLQRLQQMYPEMTFVTEPMSIDVVHAYAPTFTRGFRAPSDAVSRSDFHRISSPHYLADYLLPGHEIWAYFRYPEISRVEHKRITPERIQWDAEQIASFGYIPVMLNANPIPNASRAVAKETWLTTVPADLRWPNEDAGDTGSPDVEPPPDEQKTGSGDTNDGSAPKDEPDPPEQTDVVFNITLPTGKRVQIRVPSWEK